MIEFHPIANVFPLIEGAEFKALVEDIREHGIIEPVWLYQNRILDGRNRYRAYLAAFPGTDEDPPHREYLGGKPVEFVVSLNLKRRHLDTSQRAMVAARLANLKDGQRADLVEGTSIEGASTLLNVGRASVERAREVIEEGAPELQHAVERGRVSVSAAADVATLPQAEQQEIVARGEREILEAAKAIRAEKAKQRYAARIERITEISAGNAALPSSRRYPLIYADPPWNFHAWGTDGDGRDIDQHFPTMALDDICKLPVRELATNDAVLYMWTTSAHLMESFRVLDAWDFEYVSNIVWVKDGIGLGCWVRNQHELLVIARRGDIPSPLPANRPSSVIKATRREHSRKPDEAYELIERMYPDLPRIELFARQRRPGWDAWGNQANEKAA
jgi:N6-adenosine-specific RNA methylase IME4